LAKKRRYHYTAPNTRAVNGTNPGYFSINNGKTNLHSFNTNIYEDFGDWGGGSADAFNASVSPGVINPVSSVDLTEMRALGWKVEKPPQVTSITEKTSANGKNYIYSLHINEVVTVAGTPTLGLSDSSTATYRSGDDTKVLRFIAAISSIPPPSVTSVNGTITNTLGEALSTTLAAHV
jgi:hypothetical protein